MGTPRIAVSLGSDRTDSRPTSVLVPVPTRASPLVVTTTRSSAWSRSSPRAAKIGDTYATSFFCQPVRKFIQTVLFLLFIIVSCPRTLEPLFSSIYLRGDLLSASSLCRLTLRPSKYRSFIFITQAWAAVGSLNLMVMTPSSSFWLSVRTPVQNSHQTRPHL